jgi:hypothetical protein
VSTKSIAQFLPLAASSREECDRYYRDVHTRFARSFLREMEHVLSYHIGLAQAAYDVNGRWCASPRTFRYVTLRFAPGSALEMSPELRETISQDHRVFLRELRGFAVEEEVLVDRLNGQTSLVKYVFEYDRHQGEDVDVGSARLSEQLQLLLPLAGEAFGLRLLLVDHVRSEGVSEALDEPGQRSTGERLRTSTRQAFVELYFDQQEWAEQWFARADVRKALLGQGWGAAYGVRVEEECGLDRR